MKYAPYSYSKIHLFLSCPYAWKLQYVEKVKPERHPSLELGARVHEIIEKYLKALRERDEQSNHSLLEEIMKKYANGLEAELEEFIPGMKNIALPPNTKVGIELKLGLTEKFEPCDYKSDSAFVRGKLDFTYRVGDRGVIIDWKTNQWLPDQEVIERDWQTKFYAMLLDPFTPDEVSEYIVELNYLRHGKVRKLSISLEQLEEVVQWTLANVQKIESEQNFDPTPGDWCRICGYLRRCPVAKEILTKKEELLPEKIDSAEQAIKLAGTLKVLEQLNGKLQDLLKGWIRDHAAVEIQGEVLDFHQSETVKWITSRQKGDLVRLLLQAGVPKEEIWEIFSTNKTNVCSFLRSRKLKHLTKDVLSTGQKEKFERFCFKKSS